MLQQPLRMSRDLTADMRALTATSGMSCSRGSASSNPHVKLERSCFGREAGIVIAGLITKLSMNSEFPRGSGLRSREQGFYGELLGINVQLFFRSEGKADVLSRRIGDSARHDVAGRHQSDGGGDQQ